jgi:hypothetical protein
MSLNLPYTKLILTYMKNEQRVANELALIPEIPPTGNYKCEDSCYTHATNPYCASVYFLLVPRI